jgi:hypothetical protein
MMTPTVACSPPATAAAGRSTALPISRAPSGSRLGVAARASDAASASSFDAAAAASSLGRLPPRFSFSSTFTPRSQSIASIGAGRGAALRPPPAAKAQQVLVGFDAPPAAAATAAPPPLDAPARASSLGPLSPGRRETGPSLLSLALSDLPAPGGGALSLTASLDLSAAASGGLLRSQEPAEVDMAPLNALVPQHPVFDAPVVRAAYAAATRAHAGQARLSGEPVLDHCLATAAILADLGLPEETVAAGLLHDVLCDTATTACQLEEYVPRSCVEMVGWFRGACERVVLLLLVVVLHPLAVSHPCPSPHSLTPPLPSPPINQTQVQKVARLSELSQLYRDNTHSVEAAAILDMLTSMLDVGALLIKLADRLHNMRTIGALARCKQVRHPLLDEDAVSPATGIPFSTALIQPPCPTPAPQPRCAWPPRPWTSLPSWPTAWARGPSRRSWRTWPSRRCSQRSMSRWVSCVCVCVGR